MRIPNVVMNNNAEASGMKWNQSWKNVMMMMTTMMMMMLMPMMMMMVMKVMMLLMLIMVDLIHSSLGDLTK